MAQSKSTESGQQLHSKTRNRRQLAPRRDPLTGLFQQDYLGQQVEKTLLKCRQGPLEATLALLQLENFYEIRSWVGKSEASLLLSDIARLLQKSLPDKAVLCHYQHYEFAVLLLDECSINACLITDRVKLAVQSAVSAWIPPQLELKCGIGLAKLSRSIPDADVVFARARHDLGQGHQHGDMPALQIPAETALRRLRCALKENQLRLTFQAIACLKEDGLQHYELRTCLADADAGLPAAILFETAVQNAMGEAIDRWVIEQAFRVLRQNRRERLRLTVSLIQNSLVSPKFFPWLENRIGHFGQVAEQLVFQISEIDVLIAQHHMDYFCHKLNPLNINLCVSHFGCTANPFRYLPLLCAHSVKLDVSLPEKLRLNTMKIQLLKRTINQLHETGLRVIAAMIDDISLLPLLWLSKVNFTQGYCLHKPNSVMNFEFLKDETLSL